MTIVIGPTFDAELDAASVLDRRFTWGPDGVFEFHPDMADTERKKVLAVLAAHDPALSEARHQALQGVRAETSRRIAELFAQAPGSLDLVFAQLNTLAHALGIVEKGASAEPEETADLAELKGGWLQIKAIRDAGRVARTALLAAQNVEEVQGVKTAWPA